MSRFLSPTLEAVTPYTPGEQPQDQQYIKLNTNESPYLPSPAVVGAVSEAEVEKLRLYSDPACAELLRAAAAHFELQPEQIMPGNGSDENLFFALRAFCDENHPLAYADITYGCYGVWCGLMHIPSHIIPLKEDFTLDPADYYGLNETIVIANPNAPTGLALPVMARPETTEGYQGFYHLCQMYGDVTEAKLGYILRDHDAGKLQFKKDNLLHIACYLNGKYGPGTVEVEIKDSYRNMLEKIKPHFHLVETARKAIEKAGLTPEEIPVRGGTDGAVLSWKGLPCPNLGTGGFNFHGVCECTTVERMDKATEILLNIIELYSK